MHPSSANTILQVSVAPLVSKAGNLNAQSEKHLKEYAILSMLCEACLVTRCTAQKSTAIFEKGAFVENGKPESMQEYRRWLRENQQVSIDTRTENHYNFVANKIRQDFQTSEIWQKFVAQLQELNQIYANNTGYNLLMAPEEEPELLIKPFHSFLEKTYRLISNPNWPDPPEEGWYIPQQSFSRINDIVRCLVLVKFLDGVKYLVQAVREFCDQDGTNVEYSYEARAEGYYAAHLNLCQDFEISNEDWDTEVVNVSIEIQISTQLQEVLRNLLHRYYEDRRKTALDPDDEMWQWNYKSDEFAVNYLGHIIHYVEGMIVDIREKHKEEAL